MKLVGGTAEVSVGHFTRKHPNFDAPAQQYKYDPAKARQLLAAAGYPEGKRIPFKVMISTSGSGQMQPLPMNELLQQQVATCGLDARFEVVAWGLATGILGLLQNQGKFVTFNVETLLSDWLSCQFVYRY